MSHVASKKPSNPYDHRFPVIGGRHIDVHADHQVVGAWMSVGESRDRGHESPSLSLVSTGFNQEGQWYAGYRDGSASPDKVAISVDLAGAVTIQVVVGQNDVRTMSLAELERIIVGADLVPS